MKNLFVLFIALSYTFVVYSQSTFKALVRDEKTKETLIGATASVSGTTIGAWYRHSAKDKGFKV